MAEKATGVTFGLLMMLTVAYLYINWEELGLDEDYVAVSSGVNNVYRRVFPRELWACRQ